MCWGCSCFTSPIPRAQHFAELVWGDRPGKPEDMQSLKEAHLGWLQGMENGVSQLSHIPDARSGDTRYSEMNGARISWLQGMESGVP